MKYTYIHREKICLFKEGLDVRLSSLDILFGQDIIVRKEIFLNVFVVCLLFGLDFQIL